MEEVDLLGASSAVLFVVQARGKRRRGMSGVPDNLLGTATSMYAGLYCAWARQACRPHVPLYACIDSAYCACTAARAVATMNSWTRGGPRDYRTRGCITR